MYKQQYNSWLSYPKLDQQLKAELLAIANDEQEIQERFYANISFGTGGLRGIIGAGTNRLNIYTVRKATQGLATAVLQASQLDTNISNNEDSKQNSKQIGKQIDNSANSLAVVIAYDCRHKSRLFAEQAAGVLAANGIRAYLFRELQPTPILSFAVRELGAMAGIVITASHNPPEYNGYKVYWADGAQVASERAAEIMDAIEAIEDIFNIHVMTLEEAEANNLIVWLESDGKVMEAYYRELVGIVIQPEVIREQADKLKLVFTPLHGTTNKPLRQALELIGFKKEQITIVEEQELPDPNFSTVESPNPEEARAFELAIQYAKRIDADVIIGTDPDGDRLGILAKDINGNYYVLTGNQTGAILLEYILSQRQARAILPENGVMIKTIVTSELGQVIAKRYGVTTEDTLTGFKYIGERIEHYAQTGIKAFQFGYEESYGYLIKDFVRDKDAIQAAVMVVEVAAYYRQQQKTLFDALEKIYMEYGYYKEDLVTISLKGIQGQKQIADMMNKLRTQPLQTVAGIAVREINDYQTGQSNQSNQSNQSDQSKRDNLPKSNVIKYILADGSWFCVRPSGTEPKLKFYFGVHADASQVAADKLSLLKQSVISIFNLAEKVQ